MTISYCEDEKSLDNFMTRFEYSKMLYENPRGIGCNKCHGQYGEETIISKYKHKGKNKELIAPQINNLSFREFVAIFSKKSTKVMPRYFLTKKEMKELYYYLKKVKDDPQQ